MYYINIETGDYPLTADDICRQLNASFPADKELFNARVLEFGFAQVVPQPQPVVDHTANVVESAPELKDDEWVQTWIIEPATESEIADRTAAQVAAVKAQRNDLLQRSDWTQLPDAPVDHQSWAAYREQLRQVKTQPGFPWDITWPQSPDAPPATVQVDDTQDPDGWDPPENPSRGDLYEAPDGTIWVWDQPRDENGQYVADDPDTDEVESTLRWIKE